MAERAKDDILPIRLASANKRRLLKLVDKENRRRPGKALTVSSLVRYWIESALAKGEAGEDVTPPL
jgi:hypothetical protein